MASLSSSGASCAFSASPSPVVLHRPTSAVISAPILAAIPLLPTLWPSLGHLCGRLRTRLCGVSTVPVVIVLAILTVLSQGSFFGDPIQPCFHSPGASSPGGFGGATPAVLVDSVQVEPSTAQHLFWRRRNTRRSHQKSQSLGYTSLDTRLQIPVQLHSKPCYPGGKQYSWSPRIVSRAQRINFLHPADSVPVPADQPTVPAEQRQSLWIQPQSWRIMS